MLYTICSSFRACGRQTGNYFVRSAAMGFVRCPNNHLVGILLWMLPDQEVITAWRDSAPFWEKHREIIRQMFAPVTQALVEDALISSGHTVLDVVTGPGGPALTIAEIGRASCREREWMWGAVV